MTATGTDWSYGDKAACTTGGAVEAMLAMARNATVREKMLFKTTESVGVHTAFYRTPEDSLILPGLLPLSVSFVWTARRIKGLAIPLGVNRRADEIHMTAN